MLKQAVILAGGKGTRLQPLTNRLPKPLVPVANKAFLHWQIMYLQQQGIKDVLLLIGHMADQIKEYFSRHSIADVTIQFSTESTPLGTGGALAFAVDKLEDNFWLLNGDSFAAIDLNAMASDFLKKGWLGSMACLKNLDLVPVPANLKIENEKVMAYKKEAGKQGGFTGVDAGVYVLKKSVIQRGPQGVFGLEEYWPDLIAQGQLGTFEVQDKFFDIGTLERLKFFEDHIHDYF